MEHATTSAFRIVKTNSLRRSGRRVPSAVDAQPISDARSQGVSDVLDSEALKAIGKDTDRRLSITDDFDVDFGVDEWHGTNAFIRDGDSVFRTYFIDSRGDEAMGSTWSYLDITALGRQEEWEDSPEGYPQTPPYGWWNYHDAYGGAK